ncbi:MOSC domain-containing protein [Saccharopolyspora erythraea]|uniref:MOSC domain-containing protein n=1 Tax=Saccharopolyspora erythraea TaxID=1836 RepID=UPI001BA44013|nr:MOSC N-terminal beta barrel domain-containing protein [Saccharopolyspora erythraea]QUH01700.1 MOSC domain-containing protein [Saccharopolyspora erythraea]
MPASHVGAVSVLRRYPVKSMFGEVVESCEVTERGIAGDRAYALLDVATGRIASAKNPRLWRALPTIRAGHDGDHVAMTLPAAAPRTSLSTADPAGAGAALSAYLGREVALVNRKPGGATLQRSDPDEVLASGLDAEVHIEENEFGSLAPPGTLVDAAPVHLITTATLAAIDEHAGSPVDPVRYRPNIVIDTPHLRGFAENDWSQRYVRIGAEVMLRVIVGTPRCAIPTLAHGDLPVDREALRIPARHNTITTERYGRGAVAGVYAEVVRPGRIRCDDRVELDTDERV